MIFAILKKQNEAPAPGREVFYPQGDVLCAAVDTLASELLREVLCLAASKSPLLILLPAYIRGLHQLGIELHILVGDGASGTRRSRRPTQVSM